VPLRVEQRPGERSVGVHLPTAIGHLRLHVLAAPRSRPLWEEVAGEIYDAQLQARSRVHREYGPFGEEVVFTAASDGSVNRFIGIDGPRWLLYGVATGYDRGRELAETLRYLLHHTVVVRGEEAYPAKAPLPLVAPGSAGEQSPADLAAAAPWRNATATLVSTQRLAPATERLAPATERLAPVTERLAPVTERLAPVTERLAPVTQPLAAARGGVPEPRVTSSNAMPAVPTRTVPTRSRELSIGRSWLAGPLRPIRRVGYEFDPPTIPIRLIGR
jgi:hypothetical protein